MKDLEPQDLVSSSPSGLSFPWIPKHDSDSVQEARGRGQGVGHLP